MTTDLTLKVVEDLNGNMFGDQARVGVAGGASTLLTGLVASWKLDNTSDSAGSNTLTNNNSVTFTAGKIGNAATLVAASSQYLSLATNASVEGGDVDYTIGFWMKTNSTATGYVPLGKDTDTGREYYFFKPDSSFDFQFSVFRSTTAVTALLDIGSYSSGVWYCVIGWHDATANTVNISVNDITPASTATGGALDAVTSAQFRIGARQYPSFESYLDGQIDNVNIWRRVLTAGERTAFYNAGAGIEHPF